MDSSLDVHPSLTVANRSDSGIHMAPTDVCPQCGSHHDAQSRISELEAQVKDLTTKATSADGKIADYESELRKMKSQPAPTTNGATTPPPPAAPATNSSPDSSNDDAAKALPPTPANGEASTLHYRPSVKGRLGSFLTRSASVRSPASAPQIPSAREADLTAALTHERSLREAAEGKVSQMSSEMEDLSVTLFQQANEMVSSERRARSQLELRAARFEERCGVLEEKVRVLERRDTEKRKRLERLEMAVLRVERVKKVLDVS